MKDITVINNIIGNPSLSLPGSTIIDQIDTMTGRFGLANIRNALEEAMLPSRQMVASSNMGDNNDGSLFDGSFTGTSAAAVDYCDNKDQADVIRHHYNSEFAKTLTKTNVNEVLKDYRDDSIIHQIVDDQALTYRGKQGAQQALEDLCRLLQAQNEGNHHDIRLELQHMNVWKNHAQVDWTAELLPSRKMIYGTDSFTFDEDNRIATQTTVALSSKEENHHE